MENNNISKNYVLMIGNEIKSLLNEKGVTQKELAEKICEKFPTKDDGKERKFTTTQDHISKLIKGKALHLDTFNKIIDILEVRIRLIPNILEY